MLKKYLFAPDEEYHVRGMVRELREEINAVRRELQNLEDMGLLISQKRGNKLFYRLNQDHIFFHELRTLMFKDREDVQTIHRELLKHDGIQLALLTEDFMKEEYRDENYSVDVFIAGKFQIQQLKITMSDLEKTLDRKLKFTVMSMEDVTFQLKKREDFLLNIFKSDKIILIGSDKDLS